MKKNKFILLILAFIFFAPSIAAYLFYQHPNWRAAQTVNKGKLLHPPETLTLFEGEKWHLFLFSPEVCSQACFKELSQLTQLRLALGRRYYNVDLSLITLDSRSDLNKKTRQLMKKNDVHWIKLNPENQNTPLLLQYGASTFIATPQQRLILQYTSPARLEEVYHDLKHLLITTDGKNI